MLVHFTSESISFIDYNDGGCRIESTPKSLEKALEIPGARQKKFPERETGLLRESSQLWSDSILAPLQCLSPPILQSKS